MIEVGGLGVSYGGDPVLHDLSFVIPTGSVVGLLGPNGSGKSTLLRTLAGCLQPSLGWIRIAGVNPTDDPRAVRGTIGYLPEKAPVYRDLTVREHLEMAASLRGIRGAELRGAVESAAAACALSPVLERLAGEISHGYRRRTGLAVAITGTPEVLLLDEPTAGLDPEQVLHLRRLIQELGGSATIVFSSHVLSEIERSCDRILLLSGGRIRRDAPLEEVVSGRRVIRVGFERSPSDRMLEELRRLGEIARHPASTVLEVTLSDGRTAQELFSWAAEQGIRLTELSPIQPALDELFAREEQDSANDRL